MESAMSAAPLVTVAIPFFDEEPYLATAVRSILNQTMGDFELLLVDDGSRDRSLEIARSFRDRRVAVISDGAHRGLAARLNEVTRRARGELVARMDADDVSHPTRLAREVDILRSSRCDAVGTWAGLFSDDDDGFAVVESTPLPPTPASALEGGILCHATMLARKPWLQANPYDESLLRAEDRDLWCRTATSSFAVVEEPLYAIRVNAEASDFAAEYAYASRLNRELFLRYGPRSVGLVRTARAWLVSVAKTAMVRAAVGVGRAEQIVRRRGRAPTVSELEMVRETLRSAAVATDRVAHLVEDEIAR
jgi:glycosyltransferase involved in cell wall biosynthesis